MKLRSWTPTDGITRRAALLTCTVLVLGAPCLAGAQTATRGRHRIAFADFVPSSAELFIRLTDAARADKILRRTQTGRLWHLIGRSDTDPSVRFDLSWVIEESLGVSCPIAGADLKKREVGLASPSMSNLTNAVWFVRVAKTAAVERWFPKETRIVEQDIKDAHFFRTESDLAVCLRGDILAMGRADSDDPFLESVVELMAGSKEPALSRFRGFRSPTAQLPPKQLAMVYMAPKPPDRGKPPLLAPSFRYLAIGLYDAGDKIHVAVRAVLRTARVKTSLSNHTINKLLALPQTTLLAYATTLDFHRLDETIARNATGGSASRYLALLEDAARSDSSESGLFTGVGPSVILVLGQDLRGAGSSPQAALMIECDQPRLLRDKVERIAEKALRVIEWIDSGEPGSGPKIQHSVYLGRRIVQLPLGEYAKKSRFPPVRLLADSTLSFAAIDRWFVFALGPEHIERIIQAGSGLVPTLGSVQDVRQACRRHSRCDSLLLSQPALGSDIVREWVESYRNGSPSLLDPAWWQTGRPSPRPKARQLGIGMRARQEPGVVVVAKVYPETAADGQLQPEDRILGVDGRTLSLDNPNADLREHLLAGTGKTGPTLRVMREGRIMDIQLSIETVAAETTPLPFLPVEVAAELAEIAASLQFSSYAVRTSGGRHYAARFSLRFVDEQ